MGTTTFKRWSHRRTVRFIHELPPYLCKVMTRENADCMPYFFIQIQIQVFLPIEIQIQIQVQVSSPWY